MSKSAKNLYEEEQQDIREGRAKVGKIRYGYYEDDAETIERVVYYLDNLEEDSEEAVESEMLRILSKFCICPDWSELITTDVEK